MSSRIVDANEAVARVAYALNDVIAIYPITPASPMGEWADAWAAAGVKNLWGDIPSVIEMQSEGGAAGAIHGALQTGSLSTTFTASQGLLLMLPNFYKIAGELTAAVVHVAARTVATHALSIFGDHSDVMAARMTGWALLSSGNVQEAQDFALIAQSATLKARVPFIHFFDGFRTSHEISKIEELEESHLRGMIDEALVRAHRERGLSPDHPVIRGTSQNPDVFFQSSERRNPFYALCPAIVQDAMDRFGAMTGRAYHLFEYLGHPEAEYIVVAMGSAAETLAETAAHLNQSGRKLGVLKVRLYRPFDSARFVETLPATVRAIAVLDRCKEPGAPADPLHLDVSHAILECGSAKFERPVSMVGGRYGLASKEFTPAMARAVFENLSTQVPRNHFTIGIEDDVSGSSLEFDEAFEIESPDTFRALFYGLGADGTVGANKESIKVIGEAGGHYAQGYFVYDSKKSGAMTVSHLRFGPHPIRAPYLIRHAHFIGCHQPQFLDRFNVAEALLPGGVLLLNTPMPADRVWQSLPFETQSSLAENEASLYVIDASQVARQCGLPGRINTVMQSCFFAISGVLPRDEAIQAIKDSIQKSYARKGADVVSKNLAAVDLALSGLHRAAIAAPAEGRDGMHVPTFSRAPDFVRNVLGEIAAGRGDRVPVSALPVDGTFPTGTTRWEKRDLAEEIPVWNPDICIQCGKCVFVCPHAVIRSKAYTPGLLDGAPATFQSAEARLPAWKGLRYTLQVAPEDCTGCGICVDVCPVRDKSIARIRAINMQPQPPLREAEAANWEFFLHLPGSEREGASFDRVREMQSVEPLFEFSGACAGCGETPYLKLLTQLFGDRLLVANATGCSSIYGGNLPTTPWATGADGRGPAWSNSLFEDNAEFGYGFRVSIDHQRKLAAQLLGSLAPLVGDTLVRDIIESTQRDAAEIAIQRERVDEVKNRLSGADSVEAGLLLPVIDSLVRKSVWIVGGDGWGYDIGYGGLDHVLAGERDVNILLLDTEVYSNTGGQCSKATPRGAVAKFASGGKALQKKDLGLIAMTYGHVYVGSVAMGAKDEHTLRTFLEAESYDGPSLIIAYSHCIAHGIRMSQGMKNQHAAVDAGQWLLYRYDPRRSRDGRNPLQLDSPTPTTRLKDYFALENRFRMLAQTDPENARRLMRLGQQDVETRRSLYEYLAARPWGAPEPSTIPPTP